LYGLPNVGYYNSKAGAVGKLLRVQPRYDFNDAALPIGASLFARLVDARGGEVVATTIRQLTSVTVPVAAHPPKQKP
jgi:hypothetical protein